MTDRDFPEGFLWGSSTAAHQVEGQNYNNDWWEFEHRPGSGCVERSGDAIDHWTRYDEDFALLASLGQNSHRLSLEWSRIEPAAGEWSQAALDHYKRVLESLAGHGLTGLVTLMHFSLPRWFAERGSWLAPDAVDRYGSYVAKVADQLGDLMPYACTINEPQIVALIGYQIGAHPPGHHSAEEARQVGLLEIAAHRVAVQALRAGKGSPQSGICLQLPAIEPARPGDPACEELTAATRRQMYDIYLDALREEPATAGDFVGVQYYSRQRMDPTADRQQADPPTGAPLTLMGWEIHPDGLREAIHAAAGTGLPVIVTENGIATDDDTERVDYLQSHLSAVKQAMDEGADVRGYTYWSSFDNFEWAVGYRPTFGLVGIDREHDYARQVRESAVAYGRVAASGTIADLRP